MTTSHTESTTQVDKIFLRRLTYGISSHWFLVFSIFLGLYVGLPFLAPVFKEIGWEGPANAIYFIYSYLCHQMPQRSFFLFGEKAMYSLEMIQTVWQNTNNPLILGRFIGNDDLGWKVAWSDRMASMYTSVLIIAWLWYPFRRKLKPLPWWGFLLFLAPMGVDGITHIISDLSGIGQGFRYNNVWLNVLTGNSFSSSFYAGTTLGTFNSYMRLISGVSFGLGIVWFAFPQLEKSFQQISDSIKYLIGRK